MNLSEMYTSGRYLAGVVLLAASVQLHGADGGGAQGATPPGWFGAYQEEGVKIGFGQHADRSVAVANARKDIAEQIAVSVQSETSSTTQERNAGGFWDRTVTVVEALTGVRTRSDEKLEDTIVVKEQRIGETWFVAVRYDVGNLPQRIARRTRAEICSANISDSFLQSSPLAAELRGLGGCTTGLQLLRRNDDWLIASGEHTFKLRAKESFEKLLFPVTPVSGPALSVHALPAEIIHNSVFELRIESGENGYVTLYNVFGKGFVTELASNLPVQAGAPYRFPDDAFGRDLIGVLESDKAITTSELYIAVFSPVPQTRAGHHLASARVENSEDSQTLDDLLKDLRGARFAIAPLHIRPKQ